MPSTAGILTKPCVLTKVMASSRPDVWKCLVDGNDYGGRPNHKLEVVRLSNEDLSQLISGVTGMTAHGAEITNRTINISDVAASFQTPADRSSITFKKTGTRTVLAVRVISKDGANPNSAAQLIDNVFTDSVNMVERFASCSYNKLTFQPFSGTLNGKSITDGMYEVQLNVNTNASRDN